MSQLWMPITESHCLETISVTNCYAECSTIAEYLSASRRQTCSFQNTCVRCSLEPTMLATKMESPTEQRETACISQHLPPHDFNLFWRTLYNNHVWILINISKSDIQCSVWRYYPLYWIYSPKIILMWNILYPWHLHIDKFP